MKKRGAIGIIILIVVAIGVLIGGYFLLSSYGGGESDNFEFKIETMCSKEVGIFVVVENTGDEDIKPTDWKILKVNEQDVKVWANRTVESNDTESIIWLFPSKIWGDEEYPIGESYKIEIGTSENNIQEYDVFCGQCTPSQKIIGFPCSSIRTNSISIDGDEEKAERICVELGCEWEDSECKNYLNNNMAIIICGKIESEEACEFSKCKWDYDI